MSCHRKEIIEKQHNEMDGYFKKQASGEQSFWKKGTKKEKHFHTQHKKNVEIMEV